MTWAIVSGKEVVPPVARQAEVRQLARQRAHRLVGVPAGQKALEPKPGMPADQLGDLADRALRQPAGRLERQRLGAEAELKHDLAGMGLQGRQERLVDVRRVAVALGRARPDRAAPSAAAISSSETGR